MLSLTFELTCLAAALVTISFPVAGYHVSRNSLPSPCPELFEYETVDKPGQWTGRLILKSEFDIKGVWIRLVFDKEISNLTVDGDFEIKDGENKTIAKVHNRNMSLEANTEKILKIAVTYDGTEAPILIEYRLNARTICPQANINRNDVFLGDATSDYFLPSLQKISEMNYNSDEYECGTASPSHPNPWLASLFIRAEKEAERHSCDATLISPSYVITAAHCVTFQKENTVVPRAFLSVLLNGDSKKQLVADIKIHPGYAAGYLYNDIAVLKLASPVEIGSSHRPICLGKRPENITKFCIAGRNEDEILESSVLPVGRQECENMASYVREVLTNDSCCLTYKPDDKKCAGISGSGVIVSGERAELVGLVNLGMKLQKDKSTESTCDPKSAVILVAKIEGYLSWIRNIIN